MGLLREWYIQTMKQSLKAGMAQGVPLTELNNIFDAILYYATHHQWSIF